MLRAFWLKPIFKFFIPGLIPVAIGRANTSGYVVWRVCMSTSILAFLLPALSCSGAPVYHYDYNDNCSKAYQYCLSMQFENANLVLGNEVRANPNNLMATYLSDYEDFITLLLNGDKEEYDKRKNHFEERIDLLDKGSEADPWYRFCKAGLYMHWAMVNAQFGDQLKAAIKFRKSFLLLRENERLFPGFGCNHVFTGLQKAAIGALPGNYQWIASLFGIKGNIKEGTAQLSAFVGSHVSGQPFYDEAALYYLFVRFYLAGEQQQAWAFVTSPQFTTKDNLLHTFTKAVISNDYRKAASVLETLRNAETTPGFSNYPFFNYLMGSALLSRSDMACVGYFRQYLQKTRNDLYKKSCWQKMAFAYYIAGDMQQARYCKQQIKEQRGDKLDVDKQAEKFAESKEWPLKALLRARLFTDGGYYDEAFTELKGIDIKALANPADKAEYFYRLGRVYQELTDNKHALEYYKFAINAGKGRHEQFAARAALQMGIIYEHTGNPSEATALYKECLDMPSHDFQNAIDQQAKAGINRIEDLNQK